MIKQMLQNQMVRREEGPNSDALAKYKVCGEGIGAWGAMETQ